ncbi:MAG TPA: BtpA/SgcQ family protein [Phycisphaerales bacterium]|nr:BtpA/SgcQ family protein [Phycisphaerales bacterium]
MVHVRALPGTPGGRLAVGKIASLAAAEARMLARSGFDGVIVENMHDAPYVHSGIDGPGQGPEVVSAMTLCAAAVREAVGPKMPVGVQVLSGGNREAVGIAHACGLEFIRCENFVFGHVADEGVLARAEAGPLLRYRRAIGADWVRVFCDLKKKHASHAITADVSLADAAHGAEFFGADGLIVTGAATGREASAADVGEVRNASGLPLLVGSGVTPENVGAMFDAGADGVIVGSWIKRGGRWSNELDRRRCRALIRAARK